MPLDDKLKEWARRRHQALCPSYDDMVRGGKTHHMAYANGSGAAVPHEGVLFSMQEFERIAIPLGYHLNWEKTQTVASTSSSLTIPPIKAKSDPEIAVENSQALVTYSVKEVTVNGSTTRVLVKVMDGL